MHADDTMTNSVRVLWRTDRAACGCDSKGVWGAHGPLGKEPPLFSTPPPLSLPDKNAIYCHGQ
eukprot:1189053-Prorocentrum_minimum.AAC.3